MCAYHVACLVERSVGSIRIIHGLAVLVDMLRATRLVTAISVVKSARNCTLLVSRLVLINV